MGTLEKATPGSSSSERLVSIDALRGFDMFWIVGGEELAKAIANWIGGPTKDFVQEQLTHADWDGFRFYDLIFPLFLFLVGAYFTPDDPAVALVRDSLIAQITTSPSRARRARRQKRSRA